MSRRECFLLALALAGCETRAPTAGPGADGGATPLRSGYDALFVGNSFTSVNDVPAHYRAIARALAPAPVRVLAVAPGGYQLAQHAEDARTDGTELARWLRTGTPEETSFDAVILQEQSQIGGFGNYTTERLASLAAASELAALAQARGAMVVLYETWGYEHGDPSNDLELGSFTSMGRKLEDGYRDLAALLRERGVDVRVAPVGRAFTIVFEDVALAGGDPPAEGSDFDALYEADGVHPSARGAYLAACVIAGTVAGNADVRAIADEPGLGPEVSGRLREVCRRALDDPRWHVPETRRPDAVLEGEGTEGSWFGRRVAISGDGARVLAGGAVSARVFVRDGTGWTEEARWDHTLSGSLVISADGNRALVGPLWRVYARGAEGWAEEAILSTTGIHNAGALSGDGQRAIVYTGEYPAEEPLGFVRDGSDWVLDPLGGLEVLGSGVAFDAAGARALGRKVGGGAAVLARTEVGWVEESLLAAEPSFVPDVPAISADGARTLLMRPYHAVLFARSGSTWTEEAALWGPYRGEFGYAAALSADGRRVVLGNPFDRPATTNGSAGGAQGSARVYALEGGALREEFLLVSPTHASVTLDHFGTSVAISGDGTTVVVGADGVGTNEMDYVGAAFVFALPSAARSDSKSSRKR